MRIGVYILFLDSEYRGAEEAKERDDDVVYVALTGCAALARAPAWRPRPIVAGSLDIAAAVYMLGVVVSSL